MVTTSRSAKVKTVSRCIAARSLGMPATITWVAASSANSLAATCVMACRDVRSLIPMITTPLPGTSTSPPSMVAIPHCLLGITPPHPRADEVGMEFVDRLHQQRLVVSRRPEQRVERHPAVDPAGGVAGVERVRQRRHQILCDAGAFARQRPVARLQFLGQVPGGHAADQQLGEPPRLQRVQEAAGVVDKAEADLVGDDLAVQQPGLRRRVLHRLGEHVVQLDHLDVAVAHLVDEVEVVATGVLHPQHIVEQQVVAIGRGEPLMRQAGRAHQHLAQLADLGVNAVVGGRIRHLSSSRAAGR